MLVQNVQVNKSKALPMFHSLTGCDTVSSCAGRGKNLSQGDWDVFPALIDAPFYPFSQGHICCYTEVCCPVVQQSL